MGGSEFHSQTGFSRLASNPTAVYFDELGGHYTIHHSFTAA
jgi:hypothetical protein